MWLRQLQQCFFEKSEQDPARDWNKYGWYYGTGTGFISGRPTLSNINMSTVKSEIRTLVTDVSYFKPNKERPDAVTSLEEWAAGLLKPDITVILKVAKADSNTKRRFQHVKIPTNFQLTDTNYTTTRNNVCDKKTFNSIQNHVFSINKYYDTRDVPSNREHQPIQPHSMRGGNLCTFNIGL
jgi:hypothetical protein